MSEIRYPVPPSLRSSNSTPPYPQSRPDRLAPLTESARSRIGVEAGTSSSQKQDKTYIGGKDLEAEQGKGTGTPAESPSRHVVRSSDMGTPSTPEEVNTLVAAIRREAKEKWG